MELEESYQACPFCGIGFTNFEFHLNVHEDCKLLEDQSKQLGKRREEMKGLNEALDFDSRLLQHFHEEAEEDVHCSQISRGPKNCKKGTQFLAKRGPKGDPF